MDERENQELLARIASYRRLRTLLDGRPEFELSQDEIARSTHQAMRLAGAADAGVPAAERRLQAELEAEELAFDELAELMAEAPSPVDCRHSCP